MKKVLLTGVALMAFAAAGFAQNNVSTINQSVGGNTTNVNQTWVANGNPANNSKNTSTITQTGVSNTEGNSANVLQIGTSNAAVTQVGKNNATNIDQQNNGERSGLGFENNATVNQGVGGAAQDNLANITQKGQTNTRKVDPTGSSHEAYIDQKSALTNGMATINQSGTDHLGSIVQNGSTVNPGGMYGPNSAFITQSGDKQRGFVTQLTDGNGATVEQSGNDNLATVNQGTAGETPGTSGDHTALVQQLGSFDVANITQTGTDNSAKTYQTGFDNQISINQSSIENDVAMSQQGGSSNRANITQSGNNNVVKGLGGDEYGRQFGDTNQFTSNQTGGFGVIELGQTGTNNVANVNQSGGGIIVP